MTGMNSLGRSLLANVWYRGFPYERPGRLYGFRGLKKRSFEPNSRPGRLFGKYYTHKLNFSVDKISETTKRNAALNISL